MIDQDFVKSCHKNEHACLDNAELLSIDFKNTLKTRSENEHTSIQQIFQQEQSKVIKDVQDMNVVADDLPQFSSIKSSLY